MIHPNLPPDAPEWTYPPRCACRCVCATAENWYPAPREECDCCPTTCASCIHTHSMPQRWEGDDG
jgi:hypothetical protein